MKRDLGLGEPEVADGGLAALKQGAGAAWGIGKRLPMGPAGREVRKVAAIEAPALAASETRKIPTPRKQPFAALASGDLEEDLRG
jgi:hypothetical protein